MVTPQNGTISSYFVDVDIHIIETDSHGKVLHHYQAEQGNRLSIMSTGKPIISCVTIMEFDNSLKGKSILWEIKPGSGKTRLDVPFPTDINSILNQLVLVKVDNGNLWLTETQVFSKNGKMQLD
jgi:hypothetical protein